MDPIEKVDATTQANTVQESEPKPDTIIRHIVRDEEGRAVIRGTRTRVSMIAIDAEHFGITPDEICDAYEHLTLGQVHAALSYYFDHIQEIRKEIQEEEAFAAECEAKWAKSR